MYSPRIGIMGIDRSGPLETMEELESAPPSSVDKFLRRFRALNPNYDAKSDLRKLCFFGDSDISHWKNMCSTGVNVGVGGAEMLHIAYYARECLEKYQPAVLILCGGENDIGGGKLYVIVNQPLDNTLSVAYNIC